MSAAHSLPQTGIYQSDKWLEFVATEGGGRRTPVAVAPRPTAERPTAQPTRAAGRLIGASSLYWVNLAMMLLAWTFW